MKSIPLLLTVFSLPLAAQWLDSRDLRSPLTRDGKPNLTAPAPRVGGKPDLSGVWEVERTPRAEFDRVLGAGFADLQVDYNEVTRYSVDVFWGMKPEVEPLRPGVAAILKERSSAPSPVSRCLPAGVPASMFILPIKMIQSPSEIVILNETGDPARQIHTDGRALPKDLDPSWSGYSVGKMAGRHTVC